MKTQILEHLHALATDLEEVGLSKQAEKVNDIFEKIADGEVGQGKRVLEDASFLGGRTQQLERQLAEQGVGTPKAAPQAPAAPTEAEARQKVLSKIPNELRTQEGIKEWLAAGRNTPEQVKNFFDQRVLEYMTLTDPNAARSFAGGSQDINQALQWARTFLFVK